MAPGVRHLSPLKHNMVDRTVGEEMTRGTAPGQSLDELEQRGEPGGGKPGGGADRDHEPPEAEGVAGEDALPGDVRLR